jgi:N-acetylglutamate synthase-like GNAT family acetyltransferase
MPNSNKIRRAAPGEAAFLSALALRSKAHWGYSRDFIKSCEDELTYQPGQIRSHKFDFVVVENELEIMGFYAIECVSKTGYELEALFVDPKYIGKGCGRRLIQHALENIATKGGERLLIQGDPNAEQFYRAAGGRQIGSRESGSIPGRVLPLFEIPVQC